jgi:hypothetical protein
MTARNPSVEFGLENRACAVIDRAYSHSVVLRTTFLFDDMGVGYFLKSGFVLANHRLRMLFLDLLWKIIHLVSTIVLISATALWLMQDLSKYRWQGPELAPSNPIVLAMALADLWSKYSGTLAWAALGIVAGAVALWILFEAIFRGGLKNFWIYAGTRIAFLSIIGSSAVVLLVLTTHEDPAIPGGWIQAGILSSVILLGIWWILSVAETLIRRNAVDLLATHLDVVSGALGSLLGLQLLLSTAALATLGLSIRMMLRSSNPAPFLAAALLMAAALLIWTIMHSYLVVVRYSTIDIMRGNVVES